MTAHVVYGAMDGTAPATTSARVIGEVIRREIGFDGLLMSDDLSMQALSGDIRTRAERSIAAGCDVVLHCNGELAEMRAAAAGTPTLAGPAHRRTAAALAITRTVDPFDCARAETGLARAMQFALKPAESV
jgi:beta-N-acetylhexosaminidase